ncbi:Sugar transporter ERD6-like 16, partial [Cucurbita argyrosperma subsp. sororia]
MAIGKHKDVENGEINGLKVLEKPLLISSSECEGAQRAMKREPSLWMVLLCTLVAVYGSFEFGSCVGYSAPTQSVIREELHLSLAQYSMFGSILTIGAMVGAVTSGPIADFIGRKGVNYGLLIDGSFIPILWKSAHWLWDWSFLLCGSCIHSGNSPKESTWRPHNTQSAYDCYRLIHCLLVRNRIIPCVFLIVGLWFVPESPRWLAKVGNEKGFQAALQRLRGKDVDISDEAAEIKDYNETLQRLPKARLLELFQSKYIRPVIIGVGLMIFQQFGGINGIGFYASETFALAGPSASKSGTISYACLQVPITVIGAILMDKSGRKPLIMVSASGTFLGCFLAGTSFFLKGHGLLLAWVPVLAISGVLTYIASFSIGMGAVPWVIMSEIFPIHVKGAAGSLVVLVNWLGAWAVSYTFNFLMSWSPSGTFFIYSGFSLLTIVFVAKLVPETKGKTLEEIQACINPPRTGLEILN